jgi:hypothetical protein
MNDGDQILAAFHPVAQVIFFGQLNAFEARASHIDRSREELRYHEFCEQHVHALQSSLQQEAMRLLEQHQQRPQIGAIDQGLQQLILDYVRQFTQRIS